MKLTTSPPLLELAPGEAGWFEVEITNDGHQSLAPTLTITGVDPDRLELPTSLPIVAPGETVVERIGVRVPPEAVAGEERLGVQVVDPDGLHRAAWATVVAEVGDRPPVSIETVPASVRGRRSAALMTVVHNRTQQPLELRLDAEVEDVEVRFLEREFVLEPGEEREVPTELEAADRSWFRELRHGALIQVRGRGAPRSVPASFSQRPAIPPLLLKIVAAITVLALWATTVIVVHDRITDEPVELAKIWVPPVFDEGGRIPGIDADPAAYTGPSSVTGTVDGPSDPAGTDVVIERVAFGDEGTTSGSAETRLAAMGPVARPMGVVVDRIDTVTDDRGEFRFTSGLRAPGFYRVTAMRPGFEVASQVVTLTEEEREVDVDLSLEPAAGGMSGRVTDIGGTPIGGAEVTITDGDLDYTATAATEGDVGTWSVSGIATPQTYQVIVSERGYSTATLIVELDGGEVRSGVDAQLEGGLGTVRGRVTHRGEGVGGVHVQLEGNPTERQTTTLTEGELAGSFDFPALTFGTYQLTFSAPGWLTQTTEVVVDRGDVQIEVTDLRPSTAVIEGVVTQQVAPGDGCAYPDPDVPTQRDGAVLQPCGGVGVSVTGDGGTWRTTSATGDGSFQLSGIEPGEYLVSFDRFGYASQYFEVEVDAGDVLTLPPGAGGGPYDADGRLILDRTVQLPLLPATDQFSGEVQGLLADAIDPTQPFAPPSGTRISIDGQPDAVVEYLEEGEYLADTGEFPEGGFRLTNVQPGAHTLRIQATGYDTQTEVIRIQASDVTDIGLVPITRLGTLSMRVAGGPNDPVEGADVFVVPDPEIYNDATTVAFPDYQLGAGVEECTRSFSPNDLNLDAGEMASWFDDFGGGADATRAFDGLCVTTDDQGGAEFRRTFSTGDYLVVAPANDVDVGDPDSPDFDAEAASGVVPLDHVPIVRRLEIQSGSTVTLDPVLQRYPTITGVVRTPSDVDDGLETVSAFDVTFEPIDENGDVITELYDGAPTFRISGGEEDEDDRYLTNGRYRIDRIPPDLAGEAYSWRLVISTPTDGSFRRDRGQPPGQEEISGLSFNQVLTVNALLLPDPEQLDFDLLWIDAAGEQRAVPDAYLQVRGTWMFEELEGPPYFRRLTTTCPNEDNCLDPPDGEGWDFTSDAAPEVFENPPGLAGLWFTTEGLAPAGQLSLPAFFRPGDVGVTFHAAGFDSILMDDDDHVDDAWFELTVTRECEEVDGDLVFADDPDGPQPTEPATECAPYVRRQFLEVQPVDVDDTVALFPALPGPFPGFLAPLTSDDGILAGLTVELWLDGETAPEHEFDLGTPHAGDPGRFLFSDVIPGPYELRVSGDHIEDRATEIEVAPGQSPQGVPLDARQVDRLGAIHVVAEGLVLDGTGDALVGPDALPDAQVTLERRAAGTTAWDQLASTTIDACDDTGTDLDLVAIACDDGDGTITFTGLEVRDVDAWEYRVTIALSDYVTQVHELDLTVDPYPMLDDQLDRYGEVRGIVVGQQGHPEFFDPEPLDGVEVELLVGTAVHYSTVTDADGEFVLGPTDGIPPGAYQLRLSADGFDVKVYDDVLGFAFDTLDLLGELTLKEQPATILGMVSGADGERMYYDPDWNPLAPGDGPGIEVQVELVPRSGDDLGSQIVWMTTGPPGDYPQVGASEPAGAYLFDAEPAGEYLVRFTAIDGDWRVAVPQEVADADPGAYPDGTATRQHTDFAILELRYQQDEPHDPIEVGPGGTLQVDAIPLPYAAPTLRGDVFGVPYADAATADRTVLEGASVTATNLQTDEVYELQTGDDGSFGFDTIPTGTYDVLLEAEGYEEWTHGAVLAGPEAVADLGDIELIATEIEVSLTVLSAADDPPTGLDGVEVEAAYQGPAGGDAPDPITLTTGDGTWADGVVEFSLPPGCWSFTTTNTRDLALFDRPHVPGAIEAPHPCDGADDLNVPVGAEPIDLDDLVLDPYYLVSGTVVTEEDEDGAEREPAAGVEVSLVDSDGDTIGNAILDPSETEIVGAGEDAEAPWRVWLPALPSGVDPGGVAVRVELDDYVVPDQPIEDADFNDGLDADLGEVVLRPALREVVLQFESRAGAATLDGMEIEFGRESSSETQSATVIHDEGVASVTLSLLRDENYLVSTIGASDLDVPHIAKEDVPLAVGPEEGTQVEPAFVEWEGLVTGTVEGEPYEDGPASALEGATIELQQGTDGSAPTVSAQSDGDGGWSIGVLEAVQGSVSFSKEGYASQDAVVYGGNGAPQNPFDNSDLSTVDVTLTASERQVTVPVESSDQTLSVDGVEVGLTWDDDGSGPGSVDPQFVAGGEVTFSLAPGQWELTTSGGDDLEVLDVPHHDLSGVTIQVPVGGGPFTVAPPVVLDPFLGTIFGVVSGADFPDGDDEPLDGAAVTTDLVDALPTTQDTPAGTDAGAYRIWIPDAVADQDDTITFSKDGYGTVVIDGDELTFVDGEAEHDQLLIADPITVTVAVSDSDGGSFEGAEVTASWDGSGAAPDLEPPDYTLTEQTDGDGNAELTLSPGTWEVTAEDPDDASTDFDSETITLVAGVAPSDPALTLQANSWLFGTVAEERGGSRVLLDNVRVRVTREGETFSTFSGPEADDGSNYQLRMRSGVWDVTATRNGATYLVEEDFEVLKDEEGTPPNWLDIVLPTVTIDVGGAVVDASGESVEGASITATSSVGTMSTTTDEDGAYTLVDLDNRVTWAVTFAPPEGVPGSPVTRYLALSGDMTVELQLDQQIPAGLGTIELEITGGMPDVPVDFALSETGTPFPTLNPEGRLETSVVLDGAGAALVEFEDLVPGGGPSIPQDRFELLIEAHGYQPVTRGGLDVAPNGTTTVTVDLSDVSVLTREVEVTLLDDDGEPIVDRTDTRLVDDTRTLTGTVAPDTNVHTFTGVEPGEWQVVLDGFEDGQISVPPGDEGTVERTVTLVRLPEEDPDDEAGEEPTEEPDGSEEGAPDEGASDEEGAGDGSSSGETPAGEDPVEETPEDASSSEEPDEPASGGEGSNDEDDVPGSGGEGPTEEADAGDEEVSPSSSSTSSEDADGEEAPSGGTDEPPEE